jgi:8-oxo-dGTP pyrophosphatase MutT (NUDIX family)
MDKVAIQSGVIPYQFELNSLKVLLITTRKKRRWVIPKGNIDAGESTRKAAEREAYEEAGVKGIVGDVPLGFYTYEKALRNGTTQPTTVEVFALHLRKSVKNWPEKGDRKGEWMPPQEAARRVQEPGLAALLHRLEEHLLAPNVAFPALA